MTLDMRMLNEERGRRGRLREFRALPISMRSATAAARDSLVAVKGLSSAGGRKRRAGHPRSRKHGQQTPHRAFPEMRKSASIGVNRRQSEWIGVVNIVFASFSGFAPASQGFSGGRIQLPTEQLEVSVSFGCFRLLSATFGLTFSKLGRYWGPEGAGSTGPSEEKGLEIIRNQREAVLRLWSRGKFARDATT